MVKRSEYDQWVQDWIAEEKAKGRKCFDVKKFGNAYYVYYQTTRYNAETKKRQKVSAYIGKLHQDVGLMEEMPDFIEKETVEDIRYGLGIDTGGTYTDAVIVDLDDYSVIAKKKSLTTHHDLSIGLFKSMEAVLEASEIDPADIRTVGISTTLATNSVLEGKGGEVGLIFIGWDPMIRSTYGEKSQVYVRGGYDVRGRVLDSLNKEEITKAIMEVSQGVDALAISGLFATVNANQERKVKELAIELTGLPTVAGHELTASLGIDLRAETAVLNGKLISVVSEFFYDVEETFKKKGITAPIMVYKGDGSVMTIEKAKMYPVETILSGPAASSMGGKILSGKEDCVVVDIGGTSTDIAVVEGGFPLVMHEGAEIEEWRTRVKAVDMYTAALGGDSRIAMEKSRFQFGPDRVVPLSTFTVDYPEIIPRMEYNNIIDYYVANDKRQDIPLNDRETRVLEAIVGKGPLTPMDAMNAVEGLWTIKEELHSLSQKGCLLHASLTPTDVMVFLGNFENGNHDGAIAGVRAIAQRMGMPEKQAANLMMEELKIRVNEAIITKLLNDSMSDWQGRQTNMFLRRMATRDQKSHFQIKALTDMPIVGIGAPARFFLDDVEDRLGTKLVMGDDNDVGNAIGAVSSRIVESLSASITPTSDFRYKVEIPYLGPTYHTHIGNAVAAAKRSLEGYLEKEVLRYGGRNIVTSSKVKTFTATEGGVGDWEADDLSKTINFIEVHSRAVGDPPEAS